MNTQEFATQNYNKIIEEASNHLLSIDPKCAGMVAFSWLSVCASMSLIPHEPPPKAKEIIEKTQGGQATRQDIVDMVIALIEASSHREIAALGFAFFAASHRATCAQERPQ